MKKYSVIAVLGLLLFGIALPAVFVHAATAPKKPHVSMSPAALLQAKAMLTSTHAFSSYITGTLISTSTNSVTIAIPPSRGHAATTTQTFSISTSTKFSGAGGKGTASGLVIGDKISFMLASSSASTIRMASIIPATSTAAKKAKAMFLAHKK